MGLIQFQNYDKNGDVPFLLRKKSFLVNAIALNLEFCSSVSLVKIKSKSWRDGVRYAIRMKCQQ